MATILVIDDEIGIRETLSRAIQSQNHIPILASDGVEGLQRIRQSRPDLILLDLNMPQLDGIGVLEAVKADANLSNIPIVILTAQAEQARIVECLEKGANDYVVKPFSIRELLARTDVQLRILDLEHQLRQSEAYHRALFERTSDPEMVVSAEGLIRQVNAATLDLLDVGEHALLGHAVHSLIQEDDRREFEVAFSGALEGSDIPIFEVALSLPNGRQLPVDTDLCSVDIHDRRHLLVHLRDIRRRKSAEAQSSMILQHIGDAIFITDQSGIIMMASHSAGIIAGYPQDELIGLDIAQFHSGEEPFRLHDPNGARIYEGDLLSRDGRKLPVEWTLVAFEVSGEIFYIGVVRNLTERRQAERHRFESDRLRTLLEIAGGAAHEINQPLTAILGYAEMAQGSQARGESADEHLQHIVEAAIRISEILKQMQAIRSYQTRPYTHGHRIVDFQQSGDQSEGADSET